ncbi:hypothetical protein [Lysinibacillus xylanilyticus]|uniref:Uncharacterized protein n=1 Tax=Lysinibacillus xylanilyticus TaxID=582475 RepID=A0A2M9QA45_9BACI|nr:hypothetical protein [Lysinibacillus xylanilyticus]PJO44915.1 hypothetical protein CWD94_04305 [Lysinibacillus xylanilyticus]
MTIAQDKWIVILLEEMNEHRDLTHVVSDEAFRYPKPYEGDLYLVGHDINGDIHFLLVDKKDNDEVELRVIEDEYLFEKLLAYYRNEERIPSSEADEKLRLKMGESFSADSCSHLKQQFMAKLPMTRFP